MSRSIHIEQGSSDWLALRRNKITASDASVILDINPWQNKNQLLQEKLGLIEPRPINGAMRRGQLLEPKARDLYENMTGNLMIPDVKLHDNEWMMASLDGISIDEKLILEIKCPNLKTHEMAISGEIPPYYFAQVQHQIYVCDVNCCHYFSYNGGDGVLVVVYRDDEFIKKMIEKEKEFYNCMITFTEPT